MKKMSIALAFALSSFICSACIDVRASFFTPCEANEKLFFVQGACAHSYEAESVYCAPVKAPKCLDVRAAYLAPCGEGEKMIFVQGRCAHSYEVEHTYCVDRN